MNIFSLNHIGRLRYEEVNKGNTCYYPPKSGEYLLQFQYNVVFPPVSKVLVQVCKLFVLYGCVKEEHKS